jgi:Ca2+-binding RTX toxin-like protein
MESDTPFMETVLMRTTAPVTSESLEPRRLFSAAVLARGVLRVVGDAGSANAIVIANSFDATAVTVTVNSVNARGVANTPLSRSFPKALGINEIWVRTGALADNISVGQERSAEGIDALNLPTRVWSGAGNDVIETPDAADFILPGAGNNQVDSGGGNDVIFAGAGNDNIDGGDGDDWIRGGFGNDYIDGSDGADRIDAGAGNDTVDAGDGNDLVRGGTGNDALNGEGGNDLLFGGLGNDAVHGNDDDDVLWGGLGDDALAGGDGNDSLGGVLGTNSLLGGAGTDTFHVRDLTLQTNDYDAATGDILNIVKTRKEGPKEPAI